MIGVIGVIGVIGMMGRLACPTLESVQWRGPPPGYNGAAVMQGFLLRMLVTAAALWLAAAIVPGISMAGRHEVLVVGRGKHG